MIYTFVTIDYTDFQADVQLIVFIVHKQLLMLSRRMTWILHSLSILR